MLTHYTGKSENTATVCFTAGDMMKRFKKKKKKSSQYFEKEIQVNICADL